MDTLKNFIKDARWLWLGLGCFVLGIVDTWLLLFLGLEFSFSGRDGTLMIGAFLSLSFGVFGTLWGLALAARQREREMAIVQRDTLMRLSEAQGRVAQLEKMAALGQVVASIAHEVRNPLAIIRGHVQNLNEEHMAGSHLNAEDFEIIIGEIDRLARVVETVGHFAKPTRPLAKPTTTTEIMDRVRFMVEALYQDRQGKVLRIDTPKHPTDFNGDTDLICQALLGLVVNAVEVNAPEEPVSISVSNTADRVIFDICDRGPGIPVDLRKQVVEPFFTTKPGGNGLGLAIVNQIAAAMGGGLSIGDADGGGAKLTLSLPRNAPAV